ncbi:hypothetical protein AXF14_02635 [Actinomyces radicidentis]|uniref:DNA methylase adenine-specific domain-containing protein n=1 Tax=Actinomyces radicidentis TaxID=111015 RepID=A0A0X8JDV9_ACTRD|nr:hypothetical protein AXF14_02635 [Actinomyces radicidentis]
MSLLDSVEPRSRAVLDALDSDHRESFAQFFTPGPVARIMTSLIECPRREVVRVPDPGAGAGVLTAAVIDRLREANQWSPA